MPILIGGDFNLIRTTEDKSSRVGDARLMNTFISFIEKFSLPEIYREGAKYTWTNK